MFCIFYSITAKAKLGSGGTRTHASDETGALNQRLRSLGHATLQELSRSFNQSLFDHKDRLFTAAFWKVDFCLSEMLVHLEVFYFFLKLLETMAIIFFAFATENFPIQFQ